MKPGRDPSKHRTREFPPPRQRNAQKGSRETRPVRPGAVLLAALLALAGCVAPDDATDDPDPAPPTDALDAARGADEAAARFPAEASPSNATGSLVVLARFTDLAPLAGVNVTVAGESRPTDAEGAARFDAVPAGFHTVRATKEAHRAAQAGVEVRAGAESRVEVVLDAAEGGSHSHEKGFGAHKDTYRFDGRFDCSATYVIITGDCLIVIENVTRTAGVPNPASNATSERHIIDFPLDLGWSALVVEVAWVEPSPPTSDGMTVALEPTEAPADGHAAKYASADGTSPLRIQLDPGVTHETATGTDMPNPLGGEVLRARAFVRGYAHHPGGAPVLGVGAATGFTFELVATVFYGDPAPEGYSAVA